MVYNQYIGSPSGLSYLTGNIYPWYDYVVFRSDEDTSVSVYGLKSEDMTWTDATVRTVSRHSGYGEYIVTESTYDSVTVNIDNPYYAYGNVIGMNYNLPVSDQITSNIVCSAVVFSALILIFRAVWKLKKGIVG